MEEGIVQMVRLINLTKKGYCTCNSQNHGYFCQFLNEDKKSLENNFLVIFDKLFSKMSEQEEFSVYDAYMLAYNVPQFVQIDEFLNSTHYANLSLIFEKLTNSSHFDFTKVNTLSPRDIYQFFHLGDIMISSSQERIKKYNRINEYYYFIEKENYTEKKIKEIENFNKKKEKIFFSFKKIIQNIIYSVYSTFGSRFVYLGDRLNFYLLSYKIREFGNRDVGKNAVWVHPEFKIVKTPLSIVNSTIVSFFFANFRLIWLFLSGEKLRRAECYLTTLRS